MKAQSGVGYLLQAKEAGAFAWGAATWSCIVIALVQCFRGQGQHFWWALLAIVVPTLRAALSSDYRQSVRTMFRACWNSLEAFHDQPTEIPWKGVFLWVVLPFVWLFLLNTKVQVGDNAPVFLAASSLVREGDLECSEFLRLPEWPNLTQGQSLNYSLRITSTGIYSNYPVGPLQAAAPVALVARLFGADLDRIKVHERLQKLTAACLSSICLGLFFLVALFLVPADAAWIATVLLGIGSAMYSTIAVGIWQHGGIIFWSLVFLLAEFRQAKNDSWRWTMLQGMALGCMLPWRPSALLVAGSLGLWVLCRVPKRAVIVGILAALAFLPWGLFYWSCYGDLLGPTAVQSERSGWNWTSPDGFLGELISPGRGFLVYQPWIILMGLWLLPSLRTRQFGLSWKGLMAVCALAIGLNFALVGAWHMWWGGWCYGSRLNSEVLPFAALLCLRPIAYLWEFSFGRKLVAALLVLAFLIHASCVYCGADAWDGSPNNIDGHPERLWHWDDPPFLYPLRKHFPRRGAP